MQPRFIQIAGIIWTVVYGGVIVWLYATEPRSFKEVATNSQVAAGVYEINQEKFNSGLTLFRREQFRAARDEWAGADPAQRDARTQFYTATLATGKAGVASITTRRFFSKGWKPSTGRSAWHRTARW